MKKIKFTAKMLLNGYSSFRSARISLHIRQKRLVTIALSLRHASQGALRHAPTLLHLQKQSATFDMDSLCVRTHTPLLRNCRR